MRHEPTMDEIPDAWTNEVVKPREIVPLDHHPDLDDACLRLIRVISYRSQNEWGCCWQGRERFMERFAWSGRKFDRHRTHLLDAGLLEEIERAPRITLRRLQPEQIRQLAEEARARIHPVQNGPGNPVQNGPGNPVQNGPGNPVQNGPGNPVQNGPGNPVQNGRINRKGKRRGKRRGKPAAAGRSDLPPEEAGDAPRKEANASRNESVSADGGGRPPPEEDDPIEPGWRRVVGRHPDGGRILVGLPESGDRGFYVGHFRPTGEPKFTDLHPNLDPRTVSLDDALANLRLGADGFRAPDYGTKDERDDHMRQFHENVTRVTG